MTNPTAPAGASEHIKELCDIDELIPQLLTQAGASMKALSFAHEASGKDSALDTNKAEFTQATTRYFELVQSICARLRAEIRHVERAQRAARKGVPEEDAEKGAQEGLGALDPGWLNSRLNNGESEFEAGLWKQMENVMQLAVAQQEGKTIEALSEFLHEGSFIEGGHLAKVNLQNTSTDAMETD